MTSMVATQGQHGDHCGEEKAWYVCRWSSLSGSAIENACVYLTMTAAKRKVEKPVHLEIRTIHYA